MLTGTVATALKKQKLFRSELDHRFGFTPFYGTKTIPIVRSTNIFNEKRRITIRIRIRKNC